MSLTIPEDYKVSDGYTVVETSVAPPAQAARDPVLEKAIGVLAFYRYHDHQTMFGGPDWEELGRDGRNSWREATRRWIEHIAKEDAIVTIGPLR